VNIFFSGSSAQCAKDEEGNRITSDNDPRLINASEDHYRLFSCHGNYIKTARQTLEERIIPAGYGKRVEIMLDSGAFTAWSKGEEVTLDHLIPIYSEMIEKYEHQVKCIWLINLDKIPGERGRTASPEEMVQAMETGDANFEVLKKHFGDRVLPVYHQNEPVSQLMRMAEENQYICVSPRNDLPEGSRVKWSQEVHQLIPGVKTHGLATTGAYMMASVPWGSVDSATWVAIGAYGGIIIENDRQLKILQISEKSGSIKEADAHFNTLSSIEQQFIVSRIENYGFTVKDLQEQHMYRMLFNRIALINYSKRYQCVDTKTAGAVQQSLFDL
jgi:hypothetical protein